MTNKEKIMLIAGCSHTAGSEINGLEDSVYNRQKSYGNQLAYKMGYTPVNIAEPGSTNPTIARSILQWFSEKYNSVTIVRLVTIIQVLAQIFYVLIWVGLVVILKKKN